MIRKDRSFANKAFIKAVKVTLSQSMSN